MNRFPAMIMNHFCLDEVSMWDEEGAELGGYNKSPYFSIAGDTGNHVK